MLFEVDVVIQRHRAAFEAGGGGVVVAGFVVTFFLAAVRHHCDPGEAFGGFDGVGGVGGFVGGDADIGFIARATDGDAIELAFPVGLLVVIRPYFLRAEEEEGGEEENDCLFE